MYIRLIAFGHFAQWKLPWGSLIAGRVFDGRILDLDWWR